MPLANPVSANPFKLAFHVVLLFVGMLALVGFLIFSVVTVALEGELRAQSEEEIILFKEILENEGQDGLIKALKALSTGFEPREHAVGLFDESLNRIEGNISLAPDFVGWRKVTLRLLRSGDKDLPFHAKAVKLQSFRLIVGRSSRIITGTQTQLLIWLGLSAIILTIGTLMLGWLSNKKSAQKLEAVDQALGAFAQGDMNARIEVIENKDQIDAIALKMNANIEQLSDLVTSMRTTASAIAHDLKTPLSHAQIALFEAIDACEQGNDPSPILSNALGEIDQLNQTFDTILRISRIKAKTDRSHFVQADLWALIDKIADLYEPVLNDAGDQLLVPASSERKAPAFISCDKGMVEQLLVNLLKNAQVHTPSGTNIAVSVMPLDDRINLIVEDDGSGIPANELETFLKPFERLDVARTKPGNGLGLALVAAIAKQHEADLKLENASPGLRVIVSFSEL